jgi:hypothetical protein
MNVISDFFKNKMLVWLSLIVCYLSISLYNGYPILYSDTATYIASGFELEAPADRPIIYGLLIRLFSLNGLSLFFVPVFQTLLFLFALHNLIGLFFEKAVALRYLFILSIVILMSTGFGWSINLLLPDIFTSIGFVYLFCILVSDKKPRQLILLFFLFFISSSAHISNVFAFFVVTIFAFLFRKWLLSAQAKRAFNHKLLIVTGILLVSYLLMGSAISKSKHVFMMGTMAQKGILQELLTDKCGAADFKLCHYRDSIPRSFEFFVWNKKSPLYTMGGWKTTREEYRKIIALSFSESKYLKMHVQRSSVNFIKQLGTLGIAEGNGSFGDDTPLIQRIKHYTVLDDSLCLNTKQFRGEFLDMKIINGYYEIVMVLAALVLILLCIQQRQSINPSLKSLIFFTVVLIVCNSALVAFASEVSNRFGCKTSWLIILLDFLLLLKGDLINQKNKHPNPSPTQS